MPYHIAMSVIIMFHDIYWLERYLSKTPNVTFVYLSKCNMKLPGVFGNSKKRFLWTGLVIIHVNKWWSATPLSVSKYKCLDLLVYALTYAVQQRHTHNARILICGLCAYWKYIQSLKIYTHMRKTATTYVHIRMKPPGQL